MKVLVFAACFVAAAAVAADLKHPSAVAQDWAQAVAAARESSISTTLAGQSALPAPRRAEAGPAFAPPASSGAQATPRLDPGRRYDAPSRPRVRRSPPEIPDNALPWVYRDEVYWLVPLGGPAN